MSEANAHDLDARIQQYRATVEQDPGSPLFVPLAEAYLTAGNAAEALEVCRGGLAFLPDLAAGRLVLAKALCRLERLREAEAELAALVALAPELEEPQELLAQLRAGQLVTVDIRRADLPSPLQEEELSVSLAFEDDGLDDQTRNDISPALVKQSGARPGWSERSPHHPERSEDGGVAQDRARDDDPREEKKEEYELHNVLPTLEFHSKEEADALLATLRRAPSIRKEISQDSSPDAPSPQSESKPSSKNLDISVEIAFEEGEYDDETRPLIDLTPPTEAGLSWAERSMLRKEAEGGLADLFDPGLPKSKKTAFQEKSTPPPEKRFDLEIPLRPAPEKADERPPSPKPEEDAPAPKRRSTQLLQRKSPGSPLTPIEKLSHVPILPLSEKPLPPSPAPPSPVSPPSLPAASRGAPIEVVPQEDDDEQMTSLAVRSTPPPTPAGKAQREEKRRRTGALPQENGPPRGPILPPWEDAPPAPKVPPAFAPKLPSPKRPLAPEILDSGDVKGPIVLPPGFDAPLALTPKKTSPLGELRRKLNWRWLALGGSLVAILGIALALVFWLRSARHAQEAMALLASSEVLLSDGSYAGLRSAASVLEDAERLRPEHGPILSRLAVAEGLRVLVFQEDRNRALADTLEKLRAISYKDEGVVFGQSVLTARLDADLALQEAQRGRLQYPQSGYLAFLEGALLAKKGDPAAAASWEEALLLSPGLSWARLALAESEAASLSGGPRLVALLKEELSARPGQPRARALALLAQEKEEAPPLPTKSALSSQLKQTLASPSLGSHETEWAQIALARRAYLDGEEDACDSLLAPLFAEDGPEAPAVRLLLGELLLARGQSREAQQALSPLVGRFPEERLLPLLSEALLGVGRAVDAMGYITRLPTTARTRYLKGRALWVQGDLVAAERELRQALKEEPGLVAAKLYLAQILLASQGASEAKKLLSSLSRAALPPRLLPAPYPRALPRLLEAQSLTILGKREEAQKALSQARQIAPRDEEVARASAKLGLSPEETPPR